MCFCDAWSACYMWVQHPKPGRLPSPCLSPLPSCTLGVCLLWNPIVTWPSMSVGAAAVLPATGRSADEVPNVSVFILRCKIPPRLYSCGLTGNWRRRREVVSFMTLGCELSQKSLVCDGAERAVGSCRGWAVGRKPPPRREPSYGAEKGGEGRLTAREIHAANAPSQLGPLVRG